ncbi:hypothetical protein Tco_1168016 [Tanacetum coccineum]
MWKRRAKRGGSSGEANSLLLIEGTSKDTSKLATFDTILLALERSRIIPGPAGIVQQAKLLKQKDILLGWDGAVKSTQEYMKKVVEDVGDIKNFLNNEKLDQVVAIIKSCSPNVVGDLTVTLKDLSGTIPETIHHKIIGEGGYGKDITVGAALIPANVLVFSPKPSMHYLNITMITVVKVFRKDTVPGSESGSG